MYEVEMNVPIPKKKKNVGSPRRGLPQFLRGMPVGASVLLPGLKAGTVGAALVKVRSEGYKFTQRKTEEGFRVWRIE